MAKKCESCNRDEKYFYGCSISNCPKRNNLTAYIDSSNTEILRTGCYIKEPTTKDEEYEQQ